MNRFKYGVALAALTMGILAGTPGVWAADCARVIGPDWNAETLTPDPARLTAISDVYHARMIYEPFVAADVAMQPIP